MSVEQRVQARYNLLTTNRLGGLRWPHPGTASIHVTDGLAIVDLPSGFFEDFALESGSSLALYALFWTAFLDQGIDKVRLKLNGSAAAMATLMQGTVEATLVTRAEYEAKRREIVVQMSTAS